MSARVRFVTPGTTKINISDGDWIEVKSELNAGDQRRQDALATKPQMVNGEVRDVTDWGEYEILRAHLWLTAWSLTMPDGKGGQVPVPITVDNIKALEIETFNEINHAIWQHMRAWIELKKKKRSSNAAMGAMPPAESAVETT